ncbi:MULTISPECIES: XTP/dITP diphosphatase [Candidatus Nitrosocaldus]|jgi:XTP/dITP diphosphohydrolase|uniref:dITP/XTP pyrophosphatase n=1 Tax=Candidatus Nitrosocaldus cavascurensis TaxID=2058097 RepID=A0A2K5AQY8_9ARCH|nr:MULTISPECIES: XTP/dITP diphosphatase [Candidatus Nitrosocaldus]SPC34050.1 dITP/XTP pyrophosphatase [Candidatus Nitrosocaldus cavascurensis]
MERLTFVTSNQHKFREVKAILGEYGIDVEHSPLSIVEIQSMAIEDIASAKAKNAYEILHRSVIVEDDALAINALNGFPGPYSSYVFKTIGNEGIIRLMHNIDDRRASFISVIAYCYSDGVEPVIFIGKVDGMIADGIRGKGWGYDPIFIPNCSSRTYAEMGDEKNRVSHRRLALERFAIWLKERQYSQ